MALAVEVAPLALEEGHRFKEVAHCDLVLVAQLVEGLPDIDQDLLAVAVVDGQDCVLCLLGGLLGSLLLGGFLGGLLSGLLGSLLTIFACRKR